MDLAVAFFALVAYRYIRVLSGFPAVSGLHRDLPKMIFDRPLAWSAAGFSGGLYASRFLTYLFALFRRPFAWPVYSTAEAGLYRFGNRVASGRPT
jgi:hypothetical protein